MCGSHYDTSKAVLQNIYLGCVTKNNTCYRHHNQLDKSCVPNLSCDQFNQSCLAESKLALGVFILPHETKQTLLE